jgi:signal transduction histidine kinase
MALRSDAPEAGRRTAIEQSIEEADGLIATFNALLSIAEAQSGRSPAEMVELDLGALVADASDLYEPLAEERGVRLETEAADDAHIPGNRQLLFQALANLIDNALKYAPAGGSVRVWAASGPDGPELGVADRGPGIAETDRARVIEPFVRLDQSRGTPGSGLGLSLVDAIARLHGATLRLEDNGPGLKPRLVFTGRAHAPPGPSPALA